MNRHYVILHAFFLLLLTACTTQPAQHYPHFKEVTQAESLSQQGLHKQAAYLYENLAKTKPAHTLAFNLLAAEAFIQSGDSQNAQSRADAIISPQRLSSEQQARLNLLYAQISLSNGDAEHALFKLQDTEVKHLQRPHQIYFYRSLAFAHSLTGDLLKSTQARIELNSLMDDPQTKHENQQVILETLSLLPIQTLILEQPSAPDILGGWMALTHLLKSSGSSDSLQYELYDWQLSFPKHPADLDFIQAYLAASKHSFKRPSTIAFLLPESGRFAKAALVIKQGFLEAYNHASSDYQPSIRFYNTANNDTPTLYHQAISEGAELIIGPLSKKNIKTLIFNTELTIPVLALNHIENSAKDNLFQFGLSPIDEATQLTNKASADNHTKILLLTPQSNQGQRIANYLSEYWLQQGGTVLEGQSYDTKENDFSTPIKQLLNLDESKNRYRRLKHLLARNIEHTERRRQDVDAIFLSANTQNARSIYPQLRFYRATKLPVYASANIYSGRINPSLDIDLNSITFCDIPWMFPEIYSGGLSKESLRTIWQHQPTRYLRLVALGIDTFHLLTHLENLDTTTYSGATGTLALNQENRITRQLTCAKFIKGKPELLEPIFTPDNEVTDQDIMSSSTLN